MNWSIVRLQDESGCHGDFCLRNLNSSHWCFNSLWLCGQLGGRGRGCGQMFALGPAAPSSSPSGISGTPPVLSYIAWTPFVDPFSSLVPTYHLKRNCLGLLFLGKLNLKDVFPPSSERYLSIIIIVNSVGSSFPNKVTLSRPTQLPGQKLAWGAVTWKWRDN